MLIAIDQNTINIGRGRTAFLSATALLDRLAPEDRVGIVAFPRGPRLEFTADRKAVDDTLQRVIGTAQHTLNEVQLSPTEVLSITRGDNRYLGPVLDRECQFAFATDADPLSRQQEMATCRSKVEQEARSLAVLLREQTTASLNMLRAIVTQLKRIPAPKTLVWVSQGMLADDRRPDIARLADEALAARVNIYVLHLDPPDHADASAPRVFSTFTEDRELMSEGLEFMAGVGRGALFRTDRHRRIRLHADRERARRILPADDRAAAFGPRWPHARHRPQGAPRRRRRALEAPLHGHSDTRADLPPRRNRSRPCSAHPCSLRSCP